MIAKENKCLQKLGTLHTPAKPPSPNPYPHPKSASEEEKFDEKKDGSVLTLKDEPDWFNMINSVFRGTNSGLENVCSNYCDTSFYSENFGKNGDGETPKSEKYSQALESQIDEEYATDQLLTVVLMKVILDKAISQRRKNIIKSQN